MWYSPFMHNNHVGIVQCKLWEIRCRPHNLILVSLPTSPAQDTMYSGVLEAAGSDVAAWLNSDTFEEHLFSFFPCTNIMPSVANQV